MKPAVTRSLLAALLAMGGAALGAINLIELYDDTVVQGDPLAVAFLEAALGFALSVLLFVAAGWLLRRPEETHLRRTAEWTLFVLIISGGGAGLLIISQLLQSEFKWYLIYADLLGIGLLAGLLIGYYDAVRQDQATDLQNERDQFAALFRNVPTPVLAVVERGDIVEAEMVNPAFEEVFDYTLEELQNVDVRDVLRPTGEEPTPIEGDESLTGLPDERGGGWKEVRVTLETDFGQREFVRLSAPIGEEAPDTEEYAFYIDVTEQILRKERLSVLSRTLRHDLRNRLSVVQGHASVIASNSESPEQASAEQITSAAEDLMSIAEQTRTVEQMAAGEYERRPMELGPLVAEAVAEVREAFPNSEITTDIPEGLSVQAHTLLVVALSNLIENGIEHNDAATPAVEVAAVESLDGEYVDIRILDDGTGIPDSVRDVITSDDDVDQLTHSMGLGLWVANWIVTNLGGEIQIQANSPEGTVVTVRVSEPYNN